MQNSHLHFPQIHISVQLVPIGHLCFEFQSYWFIYSMLQPLLEIHLTVINFEVAIGLVKNEPSTSGHKRLSKCI